MALRLLTRTSPGRCRSPWNEASSLLDSIFFRNSFADRRQVSERSSYNHLTRKPIDLIDFFWIESWKSKNIQSALSHVLIDSRGRCVVTSFEMEGKRIRLRLHITWQRRFILSLSLRRSGATNISFQLFFVEKDLLRSLLRWHCLYLTVSLRHWGRDLFDDGIVH